MSHVGQNTRNEPDLSNGKQKHPLMIELPTDSDPSFDDYLYKVSKSVILEP